MEIAYSLIYLRPAASASQIFRMPEEEGLARRRPHRLCRRLQTHILEEAPHAQAQHQFTDALPVLAVFRPHSWMLAISSLISS